MVKVDSEKGELTEQGLKAMLDLYKHLSTLSSGAIIVVATAVEKLYAAPSGKWLAVVSIVAFTISALGAVLSMVSLNLCCLNPEKMKAKHIQDVAVMGTNAALWGITFGLLLFALFAVVNLVM